MNIRPFLFAVTALFLSWSPAWSEVIVAPISDTTTCGGLNNSCTRVISNWVNVSGSQAPVQNWATNVYSTAEVNSKFAGTNAELANHTSVLNALLDQGQQLTNNIRDLTMMLDALTKRLDALESIAH